MAENPNPDGNAALPQPQPVFDVTPMYAGEIPSQLKWGLIFSIALAVGAALPWWGAGLSGGWSMLQLVLLVASLYYVWSSLNSMKTRRPSIGAIFMVDMLALLCVLMHFDFTHKEAASVHGATLASLKAQSAQALERRDAAASNDFVKKYNDLLESGTWGFVDVVKAPFGVYLSDAGSPERAKLDDCWKSFGVGFHFSFLAAILHTVFIAAMIGSAVSGAKKATAGDADAAAGDKKRPSARASRAPAKADAASAAGSTGGEAPKA